MIEAGNWLERSLADSWGGIALLFLLFVYFFLGSLGYGALFRRWCRLGGGALERTSDAFLFASALLWAVATALASAHGLWWLGRGIGWALFFPGFMAAVIALRSLTLRESVRRHSLFLGLFAVVAGVRALTAALPARHGDPLLYHLLGPRVWMEAGGFTMHPQLPNALLASSWETLYLWPQIFWFSAQPFYGLVEAHLFSQWIHLFVAWFGCSLLVMRLFRGSISSTFLPMVGLAALFVAGVQWTAPLAKNDAGIAFWALGAIVFFTEGLREGSRKKALFSGLFAGLALSGKITALVSLGPVLLCCFLAAKPWQNSFFAFRSVPPWLLGFLAGMLPISVRNLLLSGNPFFPLFSKIFPSPFISKTWEAHFAQVHPSSPLQAFPRIWLRLPELAKENPFILVAVVVIVLTGGIWLAKKRRNGDSEFSIALIAGALLAYVLFVVTQSREIELRYLGASLMILAGGGVAFLLRWAEKIPTAKIRWAAIGIVLVGILAASKLPLHVLSKIWREPLGVAYLRTHTAGEAKAWLRQHSQGGFAVVAGDNESYYLSPIAHAVVTERPDLDAATQSENTLAGYVSVLCRLASAKYLLDARPQIGAEAKFGASLPAEARVFSAHGAHIYDLAKIEATVSSSSKNCL